MTVAQPLYAGLKDIILGKIRDGVWPAGHKLPSENDLVLEFGLSRMTVNRALRELSIEGAITRMQGIGSFVADVKPTADLLEVHNIAEEIAARGHVHSARVVLAAEESAMADVAVSLGLPPGAKVFHTLLIHHENGLPVQLEDRYVNPAAAPAYLANDFLNETPYAVLMRMAPLSETEHVVEAVRPSPWEARLLAISLSEPCLLLRRRTWSGEQSVTSARLLYPGSRYRLQGRQSR
jgi:GntR family histidine utilization transcriptional repressor